METTLEFQDVNGTKMTIEVRLGTTTVVLDDRSRTLTTTMMTSLGRAISSGEPRSMIGRLTGTIFGSTEFTKATMFETENGFMLRGNRAYEIEFFVSYCELSHIDELIFVSRQMLRLEKSEVEHEKKRESESGTFQDVTLPGFEDLADKQMRDVLNDRSGKSMN